MIIDVSKNVVGTINFSEAIDEGSVESQKNTLNTRGIGPCIVEVRTNEGTIPHMHIDSIDGKFKACVCLHTNKYFSHTGQKYKQFSNARQLREFDNWLRKENIKHKGEGLSNYEAAVKLWYDNGNPDVGFDMTVQPDYTTMSEEIQNK